jgi:hypothetical protein
METYTAPARRPPSCAAKILIGAIILLLLVVLFSCAKRWYRTWRLRQLGPPADCSEYRGASSGLLKFVCDAGVEACAKLGGHDARACNAAVGACMPVLRAATARQGGTGVFGRVAPHVPACAGAVYKISPAGAAKAVKGAGFPIRVPAGAASLFQDPEARQSIQTLADFAPAAAQWGLAFGQDLTAPKGSFTPGPTQECDPLCPKAECYADMGCGPAGYCMAYFADDPTYGGKCAPA